MFSTRDKAKLITNLLAVGTLPNAPKWMKTCASEHCTQILTHDPFGLQIYFIALSNSLSNSRSKVGTSNESEAFWKVTSIIGNFISCTLAGLKDTEKKRQFIDAMADQTIQMIMTSSKFSIHAAAAAAATTEQDQKSAQISEELATDPDKENRNFFIFGIYTAYYLTKLNSKIAMDKIWKVLYKDWFVLPMSLAHVTDVLEITEWLLACGQAHNRNNPNAKTTNNRMLLLIAVWRIHFFTYVAARNYLLAPVQSVDMAEKMKVVSEKLEKIFIELFETVHFTTNLRICDLLCNLTFNLDEDNHPSSVSLQWVEVASDKLNNKYEIILEVKPIEKLELDVVTKNGELFTTIKDGVKVLVNLLHTKPMSKLLPQIFEELLEEDVRHETEVCHLNPLSDPESVNILQTFDLQQSAYCSRLTTMLLLFSFENNIDIIIASLGIDNGKKVMSYLMLVLRRVVLQIEESASKNVEFIFKDTLISIIRTTECVMDLLYASEAFTPSSSSSGSSETNSRISWDGFTPLIPYLHRLKECNHPNLKDEHVQEAIDNLHIRIVTHCKGKERSGEYNRHNESAPYYVALRESNDSLPYIQANGLLNLRRLLDRKDELAIGNTNVIFGVFQSALEQTDSYVYLQAIRGLSMMGSKWTSECLPKLISDYKQALYKFTQGTEGSTSGASAGRFFVVTKLGEAITKIMKELGPFAIKYRDHVFDATICLMRDNDPLLRTSGLSTLAELCEILEIPLQHIANHVWNIIESLALDSDVQVRRAAFYLGTKCLRGISNLIERDGPAILYTSDNFGIFLRNAAKKVKLWRMNEQDEQCRLHLQLSEDELQRTFNVIITVPETTVLEKKISIFGS